MPEAQNSKALLNKTLKQWKQNRRQLITDKNGVTITDEAIKIDAETSTYSFKKKTGVCTAKLNLRQFEQKNRTVTYKFLIKCNRNDGAIQLINIELLQPDTGNMFKIIDPNGCLQANKCVKISAKSEYFIFLEFTLSQPVIGRFEVPVVFNFALMTEKQKLFTIAREVVIILSEDIATANLAEIRNPYVSLNWMSPAPIIHSSRGRLHFHYTIPHNYRKILETNCQRPDVNSFLIKQGNLDAFQEITQTVRNELENYNKYFHLLLWFDEISQCMALNKYNMSKIPVQVNRQGEFVELQVPGLNEKRPTLIRGDRIHLKLVQPAAAAEGEEVIYEGIISDIRYNLIKVSSFDVEFFTRIGAYKTVKCDVRLILGRLPYERMHSCLEHCVSIGILPTLFPDPKNIQPYNNIQGLPTLSFINKNIASNVEQKIAVENIVNNTSMGMPYIVFGAPGTGKTVTIVEAILQIKQLRKNAKILVCAPANEACDMLALKLQPYCTKNELIRACSESRETPLPEVLKDYSNFDGEEYRKLSAQSLMRYRIVVCTLVYIAGFINKYTADILFIDEASHASEPESNCGIALLTPGNQVVLAGDPKQLGPVSFSNFAKPKLELSLLERLMTTNALYKNNDKYIVMLKKNFRSHPTILKIPNDLFYNGQLTAVNKSIENDPIARYFIYPLFFSKRLIAGDAVEFCAISGKERRNGNTPSYFNELEVESVMLYVRALMSLNQLHKLRIDEQEIGVVTPYKRQVYRIKECLEKEKWHNIEVGTVETFQGKEKRVIIVTTVRAQASFVLQDKDYKLGFVKDAKRFNVALTRATSKLIVIGCPSVLSKDTKWEAYIKFCQERKGYFGIEYETRTERTEQSMLKAFQLVEFEG